MCARSVELFVDVHVVKRHAIVDVLCRPVVNVVIGVHFVVLSVPLVVVHVVPIFLAVLLCQFIPTPSCCQFSHMFSLYYHDNIKSECGHPLRALLLFLFKPASGLNLTVSPTQLLEFCHNLSKVELQVLRFCIAALCHLPNFCVECPDFLFSNSHEKM